MKTPKEPTEDFFSYVSKRRNYTFINFRGKRQTYKLFPEEQLTYSKCPICEVYMIVWHGEIDSVQFCPSCNRRIQKTEEYIVLRKTLSDSFFQKREHIKRLKKELKLDEALLKFIENKVANQKKAK